MSQMRENLEVSNAFFLTPLLKVLEERGEHKLITDFGNRFQLAHRSKPESLDVNTVITLLETVVNEFHIYDIGLRIAAKHTVDSYGVLGRLMESAGIFIDVINSYVHHFSVVSNIVTPRFGRTERGTFEISLVFNYRHPVLEKVFGDILLFSLQDNFSHILGSACKPQKVSLISNKEQNGAERYGLVFNGTLGFSEPLNAITYDAYWLSRYLDKSERIFEYMFNKLVILSGDEQKTREAYEFLMVVYNCMEVDHCFNQTEIAKFLGFSKRTLVRRYQHMNIKYTELVDVYRRRKAVNLLADKSLTINDIAYRLGFWERSTFDKKFRHWYGITPAKLRKAFHYQETPDVQHGHRYIMPETVLT